MLPYQCSSTMKSNANVIHKDIAKLPVPPSIADYQKIYQDFSWKKAESMLDFFEDGTMNIAHIAIDRHAQGDKRDKEVSKEEGENEEEEEAPPLLTSKNEAMEAIGGQEVKDLLRNIFNFAQGPTQ